MEVEQVIFIEPFSNWVRMGLLRRSEMSREVLSMLSIKFLVEMVTVVLLDGRNRRL
jgi:hypothetical protein